MASSEEKKQKIIAHRGMSGKYPENTILAFEAARLLGLRWIETDINMLGDETLVVFHDKSFGRTVSGNCLTKNVSWKDFKDLDNLASNQNQQDKYRLSNVLQHHVVDPDQQNASFPTAQFDTLRDEGDAHR